jgi:hypothetical protein
MLRRYELSPRREARYLFKEATLDAVLAHLRGQSRIAALGDAQECLMKRTYSDFLGALSARAPRKPTARRWSAVIGVFSSIGTIDTVACTPAADARRLRRRATGRSHRQQVLGAWRIRACGFHSERRRQRDAIRRTWMTYSSVYHPTRNPDGSVLVVFVIGRCAPAVSARALKLVTSMYSGLVQVEDEREQHDDIIIVSSTDAFNQALQMTCARSAELIGSSRARTRAFTSSFTTTLTHSTMRSRSTATASCA